MTQGFWSQLKKPFFVLAPMADVTDAAFRRVIAQYGKPSAMWTEFVSADGLAFADEKGKAKLMKDLIFSEEERPIVAQFFTAKPHVMRKAAELAHELGFDGIDINMGCPDRSIEKQGAGVALMKTPELALELIKEAKKGAGKLPVSVKTRIGYLENELDMWLPALLSADVSAVTLHLRTRKEMSKVPAHWELAKRAVEIRDKMKSETLLLGNGDVLTLPDARAKAKESGLDGIMLGKAIFGNPWLFSELAVSKDKSYDISYDSKNSKIYIPTVEEKLQVMVEHTKLFEELLGETKNFAVMKKHYKAYVNGFDGAKELRTRLMEATDANEVESLVEKFLA